MNTPHTILPQILDLIEHDRLEAGAHLGAQRIFFAGADGMTADATKIPYLVFGLLFVLLALLIRGIRLPSFRTEESSAGKLGALAFPQLRGGVLAIFFYVGAEVTIGSLIISFVGLPEVLGLDETVAKNYLSMYWGGAMIGRFLGSISLSDKLPSAKKLVYMLLVAVAIFGVIFAIVDLSFSQVWPFLIFMALNFAAFALGRSLAARTMQIFAVVNIGLLAFAVLGGGIWAIWALLGIGLFNSIMWSNVFTLSIRGLGAHTSQGASLLVMGILGGALVPLLQGWLADEVGLRLSFLMPILCYAYIFGYGWYCNRLHRIAYSNVKTP